MELKSLRLIAALLDYPSCDILDYPNELIGIVKHCEELSIDQKKILVKFINKILALDLMDAQSNYVDLFDRGRSLSLLLFEHVHGESRDRGQAMIDLMSQYEEVGLHLSGGELPDYLPRYLEYVSQLRTEDAKEGLQNIAPILALITERLKQRDSYYFDLFEILMALSEENVDFDALYQQVSSEDEDYTPEALDAAWEEEQVRFLGEEGCNSALQQQHQRRFVNNVSPQYLNISDINGVQQ